MPDRKEPWKLMQALTELRFARGLQEKRIRSTDKGSDSSNSRQWLEHEALLLKSETNQNFQLWNVLYVRKLWDQRPPWLRLSIPNCRGDHHIVDRIANIFTSIPFIIIGIQAPRNGLAKRLYADSVVGVGLASSFYHCSSGDARQLFRYGDYAMIATSTLLLSKALRKEDSKILYATSAALLPIQPALVSAFHVGLMEVTFAQRAQREPHLRKAHTIHAISTLVGCALFIADDIYPDTPFLHAAWHVAAAIGTATCVQLLK
ncbi:hypothetical protein KP509_28G002200 [Ceratopteris richardii]|uniref:Uncharacterized protein n=1 Tax=Ceratopteris richardii TaxID=49495 RepID=A0A8T2RA33_CERRI|nr:hypothetical protein KP509_28G002200 [Ceratopteris richardii]